MKLLFVFAGFSAYCLLFSDGFPVVEDNTPSIIGPERVHKTILPGKPLMLHCEALTNQDDVTLIYWLVNGTFPEDSTIGERIVELQESTALEGAILQKSLFLKKVAQEDFKSNFTCVVTNAFGSAHKVIQLIRILIAVNKCTSRKVEEHEHTCETFSQ